MARFVLLAAFAALACGFQAPAAPASKLGLSKLQQPARVAAVTMEEVGGKATTIGAAAVGGILGVYFFHELSTAVVLSVALAYGSTLSNGFGKFSTTAGRCAAAAAAAALARARARTQHHRSRAAASLHVVAQRRAALGGGGGAERRRLASVCTRGISRGRRRQHSSVVVRSWRLSRRRRRRARGTTRRGTAGGGGRRASALVPRPTGLSTRTHTHPPTRTARIRTRARPPADAAAPRACRRRARPAAHWHAIR